VPLDTLATIDGNTIISPTVTLRLIVTFSARAGCDLPADVLVMPSGEVGVALSARLWSRDEATCGPQQTITREVTAPPLGTPGAAFVVSDVNGKRSMFVNTTNQAAACTASAPGDLCDDDCDCTGSDPATICLTYSDGSRRCGRACHEDAQCRLNGSATFCGGPPDYACVSSQACRSPNECPFGESVVDCVCQPPLSLGGALCSCDADCPADSVCGDGACVQVCTGAHTCGVYGEGEGGSACFGGRCESLI
jgi:hypothetical protein